MSGRKHTALWLVCLGTCLVRGGGTAKVTASTKVYDDISCGGEMRSVVKKKKSVFYLFRLRCFLPCCCVSGEQGVVSCMRGGSLRPEGTGELLLAVGQQLRPSLSRGPLPFPCSDAQAQDSLQLAATLRACSALCSRAGGIGNHIIAHLSWCLSIRTAVPLRRGAACCSWLVPPD